MAAQYPDWAGAIPVFLLLDYGDNSLPYRLRHAQGYIGVYIFERDLEEISSGQTNVSTLSPVTAWLDMSQYTHLRFVGWTEDADPITFIVEMSDDGTHPDVAQQTNVITEDNQASIDVAHRLARYWRIQAQTTDPFPLSTLNWRILGRKRVE